MLRVCQSDLVVGIFHPQHLYHGKKKSRVENSHDEIRLPIWNRGRIYSNSYILLNFHTNESFTIQELPWSTWRHLSVQTNLGSEHGSQVKCHVKRIPELPIRDCAERPNILAQMCPKLSAIDVTAETMHKRFVLVSGRPSTPFLSPCPWAPVLPPFHTALNSRNTQS